MTMHGMPRCSARSWAGNDPHIDLWDAHGDDESGFGACELSMKCEVDIDNEYVEYE